MSQSHSMLFAALLLGGCVVPPSTGEVADPDTASLGDVQLAYGVGPGEGPPLDPECPNGGNHTVHNPGFPAHETGVCAAGGGFGIDAAVVACGGRVKYYTASCDDFPATAPYQPVPERAWTVYVGCCANGPGPGPGPRGPGYGIGPGPIGPGPVEPGPGVGPIGPGPIGPGLIGHGPIEPGPGVGPVPIEGPGPNLGLGHGPVHGGGAGPGTHAVDDGAPPGRSPALPQTPGTPTHGSDPGSHKPPQPSQPPPM